MDQPLGYEDGSRKVCRLLKGLYGLKQSPRIWSLTLYKFMKDNGFTRGETDMCVYRKMFEEEYIYMILYVDDVIIGAKTQAGIEHVKSLLQGRFKMSDIGNLSFCLGMKFSGSLLP